MADIPDFSFASADEIGRALGARLKAVRLLKGLRQVDLAASAGVAPATLKALENTGQCTLASWIQVVRALALEAELQALFQPAPALSIAALEAQAEAPRQRATHKRQVRPARPPRP